MARKPPPIPKKWKLPELDKQAYLAKIQPYLMLWLAIKKACNAYNVKTNFEDYVSPATIGMWYQEIDSVRDQIDAWRESPDMMAHKAWVDNLRTSNFAAAKAWLEVKDRETFGVKEDSQARVIIEFATPPSPFSVKDATPTKVVSVPIKEPLKQSVGFHANQTKKKSVKPSNSKKPKSGPNTKKKSSWGEKKGGEEGTGSKSK